MKRQPIIQVLISPDLKKEKWILKELFLRVGFPFTFVKSWDDFAVKIAYGSAHPEADLVLEEKNKAWIDIIFPEVTRIEDYDIPHLPTKRPARLFSDKYFNIDIVGMGEYFLSGRGIQVERKSDKTSLSKILSYLQQPIWDNMCGILREFIKEIFKKKKIVIPITSIWPNKAKIAVAVTHDIDHLVLGGLNSFCYDILLGRKNEALFHKQFMVSLRELISYGLRGQYSPIHECFKLEEKARIVATYFIYAGNKYHPCNPSYGFNDRIVWHSSTPSLGSVVNELVEKGFEIGLHASTISAVNTMQLDAEIRKLKNIGAPPLIGVRHHRLAFDGGITPKIQSESDVKYDSSIGMNKGPAFVAGTAYPFTLYSDNNERTAKPIFEMPITFQDFHVQFSYKSSQQDDIMENMLLNLEQAGGGVLNIIWHPERFADKKNGKQLFLTFSNLISLNKDRYWFSTLSEILDRWMGKAKTIFLENS